MKLTDHVSGRFNEKGLRHLHGEAFRYAFDEVFGLLYFDLKLIAGACGMMGDSISSETRTKAVSVASKSVIGITPMMRETMQAGTLISGDFSGSACISFEAPIEQKNAYAPKGDRRSSDVHRFCGEIPQGAIGAGRFFKGIDTTTNPSSCADHNHARRKYEIN